jgi:ribonuclease HI
MSLPLPNSLWDLFQSWPFLFSRSLFASIWKCIPVAVVWAIWWERNKIIFRNEKSNLESVLDGIENAISERVNTNVFNCMNNISVTAWDYLLLKLWKKIKLPPNFSANWNSNHQSDRLHVKWSPPSRNFLKLNFDGCSRGNPGKSGLGACIRNWQGEVVAIKADVLPVGTSNLAEAQALLAGLILAKRCNVSSIHIEGDSQVIINACLSRSSHTWKLSYILQQCWDLIDSFQDTCFSHTLREGNKLADCLANLGCEGSIFESLHSQVIFLKFPCLVECHIWDTKKMKED